MVINREDIFEALLAIWTADATCAALFKTITRRWISAWDDQHQRLASVPLLVQQEMFEDIQWTNTGIGGIRNMTVKLEIYGKIPGAGQGPNGLLAAAQSAPGVPVKSTPGATVLHPLIDAVDNALDAARLMDGRVTLGGLVYDCRIEGGLVKVLGDEDPSGLCGAIVPVKIQVP